MDPVDIARQAYTYALENGYDTMIVDTAGRQVYTRPLTRTYTSNDTDTS